MGSGLLALLVLAGLLFIPAAAAAEDVPEGLHPVENLMTSDLAITCKNLNTGMAVTGARIYLDGGYAGTTSGNDGRIVLPSVSPGDHTIRALSRGYLENITTVHIPDYKETVIALHPEKLIPIGDHGPVEERMDIVFVPSKTQYDCTKKQKITTDYYTANEENFRRDVNTLIEKRILVMNAMTLNQTCLPEGALNRFNFYYYSDPGDYADAFAGCAGTLPEDFWEEAPFTDVAIIVYPTYKGLYTGPPCEPNGCASSMGPGIHSWFKAPADSGSVFMHEAGHAIFGLIDTYCGETYYTQNDPNPNVWTSLSACQQAAKNNGWDPALCRRISQNAIGSSSPVCQKDFWRLDPEPDLMGTSIVRGKLGYAATLHVHYMLDNINRWNL
jgi:hypothetical protein